MQPKLSFPYPEPQLLLEAPPHRALAVLSHPATDVHREILLLAVSSGSLLPPLNQHFVALPWSSPPFSPALGRSGSACALQGRGMMLHPFPLAWLPARRKSRAERKRWCCMQRLSRSLSHRLWRHLPATSSQLYCLKLDVILFSDLSEEDKAAEGRVRLCGALHRVRKSLLR